LTGKGEKDELGWRRIAFAVFCPAPFQATVVGIPGRMVEDHRKPFMGLEYGNLPDTVVEAIEFVLVQQDRLEEGPGILAGTSGIMSPEEESQEKTMIETPFSQGGGI